MSLTARETVYYCRDILTNINDLSLCWFWRTFKLLHLLEIHANSLNTHSCYFFCYTSSQLQYGKGKSNRPYIKVTLGLCSRSPVRASCVSTRDPGLQADSHLSPRVKRSINTLASKRPFSTTDMVTCYVRSDSLA